MKHVHPQGGHYEVMPLMDTIGGMIASAAPARERPLAGAMTPKPEPTHIRTREQVQQDAARRTRLARRLFGIAIILVAFATVALLATFATHTHIDLR